MSRNRSKSKKIFSKKHFSKWRTLHHIKLFERRVFFVALNIDILDRNNFLGNSIDGKS